MKPIGILTALRTGAYLHQLQLLSEEPAHLAEFYGWGHWQPAPTNCLSHRRHHHVKFSLAPGDAIRRTGPRARQQGGF